MRYVVLDTDVASRAIKGKLTDPLAARLTGMAWCVTFGHAGPVLAVAYAPGGATLATGGEDGTALIWDTRTGQQQHQLTGHTGPVLTVAYSPDGTTLATGGSDGKVLTFDAHTSQQQRELTGQTGRVSAVAYSPDGSTLATGAQDTTVWIWDTRTGQQQHQLTGHTDHVRSVAYAPDGATLATGGEDGTALIWDTRTGQQQHQLTGPVSAMAYSPDGKTLATGDQDGVVMLWDIRTGQQQQQLTERTDDYLWSMAYARDGTTLAAGGDYEVLIWDTRTGQQQQHLADQTGSVLSVAYAPDGKTLATVGDTTIRIWNPRNGDQVDGTGFGVTRRIGRPLAGVRSDAPSEHDLIAATSDVETLADLIAAAETSPPLAIALIGDWGVGKSSVMLQIQRRINVLAEMSRNNPGLSVFASNVRQVRFNAWDYSDDQVWSGLVDHLFGVLGADSASSSNPPDPRDAETLRRDLAEQQAAGERLSSALSAADRTVQPQGFLAPLGSPAYTWRVVAAAFRELACEIRSVPWVLLAWAALGAIAYGTWSLWGSKIGAAAAVVAAVVAPVVVVGQRLRNWHRTGMSATAWLRRRLNQQQRDTNQKIANLTGRLALIDASARLSVFARWLIRSLEYHYRELFSTVDGRAPTVPASPPEADAEAGLASPVDYLDKIFQIPYVLAPPPPAAMASYLGSLLPPASFSTATPPVPATVGAMESVPAELRFEPHEHEGQMTTGAEDRPSNDDELTDQLTLNRPDADHRQRTGIPGNRVEKEQSATQWIEEPDTGIPDLRPLGLQVSQPEAEFMTRLGPLLPTPRAAKKLVNLYRLVRIGIPDSGLAAFTGSEAGGQYQVVQILLVVLVGSPAVAQRIFRELMAAIPESDIVAVFAKAGAADLPESHLCARIATELGRISESTPLMTAMSEYQRWCPILARYSFHTRTMTAKPQSIDASSKLY